MKYVERCLWDYKANIAMLETLKLKAVELRSVHGHDYEAHSVNGISDPVAEVAARKIVIEEKIHRTGERVKPVRQLHEDLTKCTDERNALVWILRLKYFEHLSADDMKRELSVSGATLYRRTMELLRIAGHYFIPK